jgi:hypothetical protein
MVNPNVFVSFHVGDIEVYVAIGKTARIERCQLLAIRCNRQQAEQE